MQSDAYTRVMLSLIAVLLALIAARHFAGEPASDAEPDRYELLNVRLGRSLTALRMDRASGNTWRIRANEDDLYWELIPEEGEPAPDAGEEADAGAGGGEAMGAAAKRAEEPAAKPAPQPPTPPPAQPRP